MADDVTAMQSQYATSSEIALQPYATDQSIAEGPSGRTDWSILPIIAVLHHTMHTGDLDYAAQRFDRLLEAHSYMQYINNKSGLVENGQ